jgi:hypothetical protein
MSTNKTVRAFSNAAPSTSAPAIVCETDGMTREQLMQHVADAQKLFASAQEVRPMESGWALRMAEEPGTLRALAEFLIVNRLCCPHLLQAVIVEPRGGAVWLQLSGPDGTKEALAAEMVGLISEPVAMEAGLRPSEFPKWILEVDALAQRELGVQVAQIHAQLLDAGAKPFDAFSRKMTPTEYFERHVRPVDADRRSHLKS